MYALLGGKLTNRRSWEDKHTPTHTYFWATGEVNKEDDYFAKHYLSCMCEHMYVCHDGDITCLFHRERIFPLLLLARCDLAGSLIRSQAKLRHTQTRIHRKQRCWCNVGCRKKSVFTRGPHWVTAVLTSNYRQT